jgi:hypothetical protein
VLEPLRNPFRREVEVDPDLQYRLANKKSLRPLAQERKAEFEAAAKMMNKHGRHNGIVQKLQKHWHNRRQQRAARRKAHGRLRMLRRRLHNRVVRAVLRFLKGVRKVGGLPFRKFRTKAKIEERREKEHIKRNRMEMMDAIIHETHEEEKHKSALHRKREKRISTEVEPSEAEQQHEKVIEKERSEKGTGSSLTSSQESNPDKLEDEVERAEHLEAHSAAHAAQDKGKEKVNDEEHGADDDTTTGQSGHGDQQSAALSHAEERKMKKEKKREEKMQKKERKGKEKLDRHHSVEGRHSQAAAESDVEPTRDGHHHRGHHSEARTDAVGASTATDAAETASVASSDRPRRLHGLLGRQQTKMRLWEEKEKDKWASLRRKWGAKRASQSARYLSFAPNRVA